MGPVVGRFSNRTLMLGPDPDICALRCINSELSGGCCDFGSALPAPFPASAPSVKATVVLARAPNSMVSPPITRTYDTAPTA